MIIQKKEQLRFDGSSIYLIKRMRLTNTISLLQQKKCTLYTHVWHLKQPNIKSNELQSLCCKSFMTVIVMWLLHFWS